jgi:peptidoglycan/LPS O-acetylase OafA/YrhL
MCLILVPGTPFVSVYPPIRAGFHPAGHCYLRHLDERGRLGVVPSSGRRLPGIEGLRALAACSVLVYHSWANSSPSGSAVDLGIFASWIPDLAYGVALFFALSGFLLYRPFAAAVLRGEALPSVRGYFRNRALRILPAYWAILLVAGLVLETTLLRNGSHLRPHALHGEGLLRTGTFTQNYTPGLLGSGIGPAWSLAVEAVFYLLLPVLALGALLLARAFPSGARWRRAAAAVPAAALLLLGLSGKAAARYLVPGGHNEWGATWHSVIELSFWGQADLFAFGMALAVVYAEVAHGGLRLPRSWRWWSWAGVVGGYLLVHATSPPDVQLSYSPENTVMALVFALLLGLVVLQTAERRPQTPLLRAIETAPIVWVGMVSYSVFLWHGPLVRWLNAHDATLGGRGGFVVNTIFLLAITLALSAVSYRFVEEPALRLKKRSGASEAVPPAQVSAAP